MNGDFRKVCPSGDLKKNSVRKAFIGGEAYALFRDTDGKAVAIEDRCIHRGAPLSAGKCENGTLRCPYHGWLFGSEGELLEIPSEGEGAEKKDWRAKTVTLIETQGWIFAEEPVKTAQKPRVALRQVDGALTESWNIAALERELGKNIERVVYDKVYSLAGTGSDLRVECGGQKTPHVLQDGAVWIWTGDAKPAGGPSWRFPEAENPEYRGYFMITDFENDVTHLIQNFMDVPHTVYVHDKWFRRKAMLKVPVTVDVAGGRVKATYHQENDSIGFWQRLLNPGGEAVLHTDEFIMPNITRVDYRFGANHFIINSECTPVSRYKSRVYTWIAFKLGKVMTPLLLPAMKFYTRQVINQDVDIMKLQGGNLKEIEDRTGPIDFTAKQNYFSSGADELHLAIDRLRRAGTLDQSAAYQVQFAREREFWI